MGNEAAGPLKASVSPVEISSSRRGLGWEGVRRDFLGAESPLSGAEQAAPNSHQPELARVQPRVRFTPISENRNSKKHQGTHCWPSRKERGASGRGQEAPQDTGPGWLLPARAHQLRAAAAPHTCSLPGPARARAGPQLLPFASWKPQRDLVFAGT